MSDNEFDNTEMAKWDPGFTEMAKKVVAPFVNLWFRAEVRGLESFPPAGGAMVESTTRVGCCPRSKMCP